MSERKRELWVLEAFTDSRGNRFPQMTFFRREEAMATRRPSEQEPILYVPAEAGQSEAWVSADVLDVGDAPDGKCEVVLSCSLEQARGWGKLLYQTIQARPLPPPPKSSKGGE